MSQSKVDGALIKDGSIPDSALSSGSSMVKNTVTVTGGGLASGGGDLSANRVITVPAAVGSDVTAGTDNTKAVTSKALTDAGLTPSALAAKQNTLGYTPANNTTTVTGGGLATGGGALSSNQVISVPKAASGDVATGTDDTKAITSKALHDSTAYVPTGGGTMTGALKGSGSSAGTTGFQISTGTDIGALFATAANAFSGVTLNAPVFYGTATVPSGYVNVAGIQGMKLSKSGGNLVLDVTTACNCNCDCNCSG